MKHLKVGDRVRRIKGSFGGMHRGDVGTIAEIKDNGYIIKEYSKTGSCHCFSVFELIEESERVAPPLDFFVYQCVECGTNTPCRLVLNLYSSLADTDAPNHCIFSGYGVEAKWRPME